MAFKPTEAKKNDTTEEAKLNLSSMMDVMTIILLFLLKSFSSGEIITMDESLTIPDSNSRLGKPPKVVNIIASKTVVEVKDQTVANVAEVMASEDNLIAPLFVLLAKEVQDAEELQAQYGTEFNREVIIQADKETSFRLLFKLLYTAANAGFDKIRMMTIEGSGPPGYM